MSFPGQLHLAVPLLTRLILRDFSLPVATDHAMISAFFSTSTFEHLSTLIMLTNAQGGGKSEWAYAELQDFLDFVERHKLCLRSLTLPPWVINRSWIYHARSLNLGQFFSNTSIRTLDLTWAMAMTLATTESPIFAVHSLTIRRIHYPSDAMKLDPSLRWPAAPKVRNLRLHFGHGDIVDFAGLENIYPELRELHVDLSQTVGLDICSMTPRTLLKLYYISKGNFLSSYQRIGVVY
jgi:hypothetical protein